MGAVSSSPAQRFHGALARQGDAHQLAELIREAREQHGMTQHDLAVRIGSTQSIVARWETGEHDFHIRTLARIAEALGYELIVHFDTKESSLG